MKIEFAVEDWFQAFVSWMQGRSAETIEIVSDAAAELYLNSVTAQHMRLYGRTQGPENLWARCEWDKTDISFGIARKDNLGNTGDSWNRAWEAGETGNIGQIEGKLLYSKPALSSPDDEDAKATSLTVLCKQLQARQADDKGYVEKHDSAQRYFGLVWYCHYSSKTTSKSHPWSNLFKENGLSKKVASERYKDLGPAMQGEFIRIGELSMDSVWPVKDWGTATLGVTLREWAAPKLL